MPWKSAFEWKYATWIWGALMALAALLLRIDQYAWTIVFLLLAGAWAAVAWWNSKIAKVSVKVGKRYRLIPSRRRRFSGVLVITVFYGLLTYLVHGAEIEKRLAELKQHRDETFDNLTVTPIPLFGDGSEHIGVSIENKAHWELDKHQFTCAVRSILNAKEIGEIDSVDFGRKSYFLGLLGGGRGETAYCHPSMLIAGPLVCVDMDVVVNFALVEQPNRMMQKFYRFGARAGSNGIVWLQLSPGASSYCGSGS